MNISIASSIEKVPLLTHTCSRRGYSWIPRVPFRRPRACPDCNSPYWNAYRKYISKKLREELVKLKDDVEVQELLKKHGIFGSEQITLRRVKKRKKDGDLYARRKENKKNAIPHQ